MSEPTLEDIQRQSYLRDMIQTDPGWPVLLEVLWARLQDWSRPAREASDTALRLDALARIQGTLDLVFSIYSRAGLLSPLEEHHAFLVLLAGRPPRPVSASVQEPQPSPAMVDAAKQLARRRTAGSVA